MAGAHMISRRAHELDHLIRDAFARQSPEISLDGVDIFVISETDSPNWSARPMPQLQGNELRKFIYALHEVRNKFDLFVDG